MKIIKIRHKCILGERGKIIENPSRKQIVFAINNPDICIIETIKPTPSYKDETGIIIKEPTHEEKE
jgi:hypothetical protein